MEYFGKDLQALALIVEGSQSSDVVVNVRWN